MKSIVKPAICGLVLFLGTAPFGLGAPGPPTNDYSVIAARNVFGLRPPQPAVVETPPAPPPKVVLSGVITVLLGNDRVLLKEQIAPEGGGGTAKEVSMILAEGQREGGIEVVKIDERAGTVRINNRGAPTTLTFEKDGAKLPATRPPLAAPPEPPKTSLNH